MKKMLLPLVFLGLASVGYGADLPGADGNGKQPIVLTLTEEQASVLPQLLDVAIKQMGLSSGTVVAIQIAQSVSQAVQDAKAPPPKPIKK